MSIANQYKNPAAQADGSGIALVSLAFAMLLPSLGISIVNVALPTLANSFAVSTASVNWVVIAYLLALVTFVMGAAVLGDIAGRKLLLLCGIGIFACASMMCAVSQELWMLVFARLIQGLGATFILAQTLALATSVLPKTQTGSAIGLISSTAAIGTALGPAAGGVLLDFFGWQAMFWLLFLLAGLSFILCARFIPRDSSLSAKSLKHFDITGTLLLALSALLYAMSVTDNSQAVQLSGSTLLLLSALLLMLFLQSQRKRQYPLINLLFFRQQFRNVTLAAGFVVDAIAMSTLVIGPFYLTYALALSPLEVGMLLSVGPLASACSGYPAGKLVDLLGIKNMMLTGLALMTTGVLCFAYLPVLFGVQGYIAALVVMTPGRQFFLTSNNTYVMKSVGETEKGLASGILNLTKNLGLITGAALIPGVFNALLENTKMVEATPQQLGFALSTTFCLNAVVLGLMLLSIYLLNRRHHTLSSATHADN